MINAYIYQGDNYHHCVDCGLIINFGDMVFRSKWGYRCYTCQYYLDKRIERKIMSNIKITAEVDGKQVPLETISTETFEAIKALEKPKEIPVARLVAFCNEQRLILKPTQAVQLEVGKVYVFDTKYGNVCANWLVDEDLQWVRKYREIRPL